jgi:hypothetical protein
MCAECQDIIDATPPSGDGATADAWDRADRAIKAWRATLPPNAEFESVLAESEAWVRHMERSTRT